MEYPKEKWTDKNMKSINIHGKEYYEVKERVMEFHRRYSNGSIETEIIEMTDDRFITRTIVKPHKDRNTTYTGLACETIGKGGFKGSELECCETSSVGRALGFLNIGITNSIASADEVKYAKRNQNEDSETSYESKPATESQIKYIMSLCANKSIDNSLVDFDKVDKELASELISLLKESNVDKEKINELFKTTLSKDVQDKINQVVDKLSDDVIRLEKKDEILF